MPDLVLINAGELVTCSGLGGSDQERLGVIEDGAMVVDRGRVSWLGTTKDLRRKTIGRPRKTLDAGGDLVTPGFVDPHTHLAFAGSREDELERKAGGETYVSILASGGGIQRTVRETRRASARQIALESSGRLHQLVANGVTTAEVKTGYGQRKQDELKMLQAIAAVGRASGIDVVSTFLGLHAKPPEFRSPGDYTAYAVREMLPAVAGLKARPAFSDCFCEEGIFSREDCSKYLRASKELGFRLKIHADEFTDSGGASLAAEVGCTSADHLGNSSPGGIEAMARGKVIAVLLPGTSMYSSIPYADARRMIEAGCAVALGTDLSPNSWIESPQLVMSLACTGLKMTPAMALLGFTASAAKAISRDDVGSLRVGAWADFVIHSVSSYRFLPYRIGGSYVKRVVKGGREIHARAD